MRIVRYCKVYAWRLLPKNDRERQPVRLTIGIHTHITNPLSSGYHGYPACVDSRLSIADEVIVVDGGSTSAWLESSATQP